MAEPVSAAASDMGSVVAAAEAIANAVPAHRQCNVEISNACNSYSLCNPRMYLYSGWCEIPLAPFVDSGTADVAVFVKTANAATGSVGVITYDLQKNKTQKSSKKMAVMFSVPYDFNLYSNLYAVGIYDQSRECDKSLYNEMYSGSGPAFKRQEANKSCSLVYTDGTFTIMATMSDAYQPVIKLRITHS